MVQIKRLDFIKEDEMADDRSQLVNQIIAKPTMNLNLSSSFVDPPSRRTIVVNTAASAHLREAMK